MGAPAIPSGLTLPLRRFWRGGPGKETVGAGRVDGIGRPGRGGAGAAPVSRDAGALEPAVGKHPRGEPLVDVQ